MTRHHQLKNEARRAEQRSDWARAIELYKSAIRLEEERGSGSDVGIYNRIGDLHLRLGDADAAVEYYEEAADRYAAHGLHTSAIALCNKILRIAPHRDEVYGRLARLHASTGLLAESRSAFLRFAERMRESDRLSEALEAVQDLVSLTGDEELRTAFADQLLGAGLDAQAVAQLRLVYQARVAGGRNGKDIRDRILAIDPDADPVGVTAPPPPRATPTPEPSISDHSFVDLPPAAAPTSSPAPPVATEPPAAEPAPLGNRTDRPATLPVGGGMEWDVPGPGQGDPGIESVLTRFRSQVREIVEETDYSVHYDLGIAYMGMDLFDDAIREFRLAMQSPALMESAHALLGECIQARGSGRSADPPPAEALTVDEPHLPLAATDDFMLGQSIDLGIPAPAPGGSAETPHGPPDAVPETPDPAAADEEELADMLFRARLAQHRARAASEDGRADHEAHLDLGFTYERMGLLTEAVSDLRAAAGGPTGVREQALDALERILGAEGIDASTRHEAVECLLEHGREAERTPASEPSVIADHPAGEALAELGDILAELESEPLDEVETVGHSGTEGGGSVGEYGGTVPLLDSEDAAALFGEAEGLRAAGRMDEAASHYYRALELFEKDRDAINAIRAVDRLLAMRPDDVVLHHQKNEFAIMTNDRELLVSSYLDLAACLRRQNGLRSARTVYGRILDIDSQNAEARAGIAAVDAEQLARERQRQQRPERRSGGTPAAPIPAVQQTAKQAPGEFDAMFEDLREDEETAQADPPDYESHLELGVAFRQMEMWEEAAREFKQAAQGLSEPLQAYERLGECLVALRRYDEAIRTLAVAITHPGPDAAKAGVLFQLGVAHLRSGDGAAARTCLERVLKIDPTRADATHLLSTLPA